MAPTVRYAQTVAGARVAYTTLGADDGPVVVCVPPLPFSHLEAGWRVPGVRRWFELLAGSTRVVLFDALGSGLSDREPADFSLEAIAEQLRAIAEALALERFALCGFFNGAPPALHFAAQHPQAVTRLVLWGGYTRGVEVYPLPLAADAAATAEAQWELVLDTAARAWTASAGEEAELLAALFRAAVEPRGALAAFTAARGYDVSADLPHVEAPALVVQRRDSKSQTLEVARSLAAALPRGELALLPGDAASPFSGDIAAGVQAVLRGVGVATPALERDDDGATLDEPEGGTRPLSERESEVLALLAAGRSNKEIAADLGLSIYTIERHLTNLYAKLGVRGRTEAVAYALSRPATTGNP